MIIDEREERQEQIVRIAKTFGNGAHVFVPKEWVGEQLFLVRPKKKTLKEKILDVLDDYLDSIVGVYLYGSYARDEQVEDSDIDLFVMTDKKLKIRAKGFEIICLEQNDLEKALKLEPLLMYSIFSEAKPIINARLLEEFKLKYKPKNIYFKEFFKDCKRIIKVNEEFLETENEEYLKSEAIVYSLVLRLRGLFIIKSLLSGNKYSHKLFKSWVKSNLKDVDFNSIYEAYRLSKIDNKIIQKIKVEDIKRLMDFFKKELSILENG